MQHNLNDKSSFSFCIKSANDIVHDLLLAIQHIIAGTIIVSNKIISETCVECKIQLSAVSPVIKLQYERQPDNVDLMHLMPMLEYGDVDENSGLYCNTTKSKRDIVCDKIIENPFTLAKQLISNGSLEENENKRNEINICAEPISSPINNLDKSVNSSSESELITILAGDSDVTRSEMKNYNWKCENVTLNNNFREIVNNHAINKQHENDTVAGKRFFHENHGNSFKTKNGQLQHEAVNTGEKSSNCISSHQGIYIARKPYMCEYCDKSFSRSSHLTRHKRIHTGEKPFACEYCNRSFSESSDLARHKRIHSGVKPFTCEHCDKSFSRSSHLMRHERIHTGEKPFACEYCGKCFIELNDLSRHRMIHLEEKPFACDSCDKSFSRSSYLSRHKKIHSGEKPFTCKYCSKCFSESGNLSRHIRVHTGEKPFTCEHCNRSFSESSDLARHKRIHSGVKPFTCEHCDKSFSRSSHLSRHKRLHLEENLHVNV